jgi:predicted Zn-dependent protease
MKGFQDVQMKKYRIFILLFVLGFIASCAVNPVTGKRELSLYSEQDEIALGKQADEQIRSQYGVYKDPALNDYVQRVGVSLTPHTHRAHLEYHFAVLDSPVVNAFAVPGGYVYVTRGILALMKNEAELAVVLGHELGHVNARHSIKRMSEQTLFGLGLAVGASLSKTVSDIAGIAGVGMQLLFLKYSRDDERQADQLGVEYSRKGGYNPREMIGFFNSLEKMGDLSGGHSIPGFLSTHPLTSERIQNTKDMLLETDGQLHVKTAPYLDKVENMVYGDDPRQGFVEQSTFYHPEMRFTFDFPQAWQLQNMPTQVIIGSDDENAAVVLQAEQSSEDLRDYAQKMTADVKNLQFLRDQSRWINGLSAYQQYFDYYPEDSPGLKALLSYIKYGSYVYTFTALSTIEKFDRYENQFDRIINSFNKLTDRAYLNRQPKRIKLHKSNGRQTLEKIFDGAGIKEDLWPRFAIMNGMELGDMPPKGTLIKTIK